MTINIVILATNIYMLLGVRLIKQLNYYYKGTAPMKIHIFTDYNVLDFLPKNTTNVSVYCMSNTSWVDATNSKFTKIISLKDQLAKNVDDYCFYLDADTIIFRNFDETFLIGDLVCDEHFNNNYPSPKPYERRKESEAYIPLDTPLPQVYYHAMFFGGRSKRVLELCEKIITMQQKDKIKKIEPIWNDESYLNKYFHHNPPTKTISHQSFAHIFGISDKGGLRNTRNTKNKISESDKTLLISGREKLLDIKYGSIIFRN
jgi:hypothetical protein